MSKTRKGEPSSLFCGINLTLITKQEAPILATNKPTSFMTMEFKILNKIDFSRVFKNSIPWPFRLGMGGEFNFRASIDVTH